MLGGKKSHSVAKIETLIGQNTQVTGDIEFEGGLHVDGVIIGNVVCTPDTSAVLTLSENGRIEGQVKVPNIILNGEVKGDVYAYDRVELAAHAKVSGNVFYNLIEMAIGAEVNGNLVHAKDFNQLQPSESNEKPTIDLSNAFDQEIEDSSSAA